MADESTGGEANLKLPDLSQVQFLWAESTATSCWSGAFCSAFLGWRSA